MKIDQSLQFNQLPWYVYVYCLKQVNAFVANNIFYLRYNRALAHPGLITLSPATSDPRRTGLLYSISKAIYIPRTSDRLASIIIGPYYCLCFYKSTTTIGGPVLSVVAGDISFTSLHTIMNSMEPLCTQKYYRLIHACIYCSHTNFRLL